ncbi:MAG: NlpC/P60 family protein [Ferruginibacter sp.]|nr:NlpC/P60 family protein [Ferruginibacter sp.]
MKYAICITQLAPMRLGPDHREELTSQFLFSETATILENNGKGWLLLENTWDKYTGWCRSNQFFMSDDLPAFTNNYTGSWVNNIIVNGIPMMVPFGTPLIADVKGINVGFDGTVLHAGEMPADGDGIRKIAALFLNTAYLWGGRSVFGIDCSGFAQAVFRMFNIPLLRDAKLQATQGEAVGFLQEVVCGDLAFFDEGDEIMHVGILLNESEIIHASGNVRIDKIDAQGIIHSGTGLRTHRLRVIKRVR